MTSPAARSNPATDDTVSPEVYAVKLEASYQPEDLELHTYHVRIADNGPTIDGTQDEDTKAEKIAAFKTLMRTAWPIELAQNFDNDNDDEEIRGHILKGSLKRVPEKETDINEEVWTFQFIEVKFS